MTSCTFEKQWIQVEEGLKKSGWSPTVKTLNAGLRAPALTEQAAKQLHQRNWMERGQWGLWREGSLRFQSLVFCLPGGDLWQVT